MTYRRRRILRQIAPTGTLLLAAVVILVVAFALGRRLSDSVLEIVILIVVILIVSAIALPVTFRQRRR
jgi:membrane protein YdbS with pleckstrin-like domain